MERSMFTDAELQLAQERRLKYQGTAKIDLDQISLPSTYDEGNVKRLCDIFGKCKCDRLDIRNHVTATVSEQHLQNALHAARVDAQVLMTNPPDS
jgi:hypothetical protein